MADPGDLYAACAELLDASIEALDTIPGFLAPLEGAPERAYVSPGEPALDCCDQLTVHAQTITEKPTLPAVTGRDVIGGRINLVGFVVTIARCVPVPDEMGNPPAVEDLQAAADQVDADAWALWNHLYNLWRADQLFTLCGEVFWDGMRALTASGGCGGWVLSLRARLDGYEEVIGS